MDSSPTTTGTGDSRSATLLVRGALLLTGKSGEAPFLGYFAVGPDGRIASLGSGEPPVGLIADETLDLGGKMVGPGFISAHSHLFQSPLRGLGPNCTLYGWLAAIAELSGHATPDDIYWFCLHGSCDFLRNGITTAYDFTYSGALGGGQDSIGVGEEKETPPIVQEWDAAAIAGWLK